MEASYTKYHKKYYEVHRDEIREKRKPTDRAYYEKNRELIKQRALDRYYRLKEAAKQTTPPALGLSETLPASPAPAPADTKIESA
jgi:hypothetical protein